MQSAATGPPPLLVLPRDVAGANSAFVLRADERRPMWLDGVRRRGWDVRVGSEVDIPGCGDDDVILRVKGASDVHVVYAVPDITDVDAAALVARLELRAFHSPARMTVVAGPAAADATEVLGFLGVVPSAPAVGPAADGSGISLARKMKETLDAVPSLRQGTVDRGCLDAANYLDWAASRSPGRHGELTENLLTRLRSLGVVLVGYDDALGSPLPAGGETLPLGLAAGAAIAVVQGALRSDVTAAPRLAEAPARELVARLVGRGGPW